VLDQSCVRIGAWKFRDNEKMVYRIDAKSGSIKFFFRLSCEWKPHRCLSAVVESYCTEKDIVRVAKEVNSMAGELMVECDNGAQRKRITLRTVVW